MNKNGLNKKKLEKIDWNGKNKGKRKKKYKKQLKRPRSYKQKHGQICQK